MNDPNFVLVINFGKCVSNSLTSFISKVDDFLFYFWDQWSWISSHELDNQIDEGNIVLGGKRIKKRDMEVKLSDKENVGPSTDREELSRNREGVGNEKCLKF